jgi:hypothetical protein
MQPKSAIALVTIHLAVRGGGTEPMRSSRALSGLVVAYCGSLMQYAPYRGELGA